MFLNLDGNICLVLYERNVSLDCLTVFITLSDHAIKYEILLNPSSRHPLPNKPQLRSRSSPVYRHFIVHSASKKQIKCQ